MTPLQDKILLDVLQNRNIISAMVSFNLTYISFFVKQNVESTTRRYTILELYYILQLFD